MTRKGTGIVLFVVLVILAAMAATFLREEKRADAGPIPVAARSARPEGTALRDGFTVAPGSLLMGDTFPTGVVGTFNGVPVEDGGWRAHLVITGDPRGVLKHYRDEAAEQGIVIRTRPGQACRVEPVAVAMSGRASRGSFICEASGGSSRGARREVRIQIMRRLGPRPVSWAVIELRQSQFAEDGDGTEPAVPAVGEPPPLPTEWPPLARPGDTIEFGAPLGETLRVEAGSSVAAPVMETFHCVTGSFAAVLAVDDDPEEVANRYRDQFEDETQLDVAEVRERLDDGFRVWHTRGGGAGGWTYSIEIFRKGGETWGLLSGCND